MSKIVFIGASGQIGKMAVEALLKVGHSIIAPVRSPNKLADISHPKLHVHEQNLEEDFSCWFSGCDTVVFAAGSGGNTGADKTLLIDLWAARNAVKYAKAAGVKRFIMVSSIGADDPDATPSEIKPYLVAKHMADEVVKASGLDYVILRPATLTDEAGTESITLKRPADRDDWHISREDVAAVITEAVDKLRDGKHLFEIFQGTTPIDQAL